MVDAFKKFVKRELQLENQKTLLAVSGGIDSVCMMNLFQEAGFKYSVAHCNFKLRGEASDGDEKFVRKLAEEYGVDFYSTSFDTFAYSRDEGLSIQMAARKLRYEWLRTIKDQSKANYIATAHHLNDSLETAIFNLAKGTGIAGLKGISTKVEDLVRPLLFATKGMMKEYAAAENLKWREDESNKSIKYSRNFIRHQVIEPLKKKVNPSIERTFQETAERLRATELVFAQHIQSLKKEHVSREVDHIKFNIDWVKSGSEIPLVFELIKEFGFSYKQTKEIFEGSDLSGASHYSENYWLVHDRKQLVITERYLSIEDTVISGSESEVKDGYRKLEIEEGDANSISMVKDPIYAFLDKSKLKFPLQIRSWREGDKFTPLGLKGKKKVSDFMIDQKIPVNLKKQVRILTSGDQIVWVVGMRIDDHFKITDKTEKVYRLKLLKPDA